jgi:hypothetical protein
MSKQLLQGNFCEFLSSISDTIAGEAGEAYVIAKP